MLSGRGGAGLGETHHDRLAPRRWRCGWAEVTDKGGPDLCYQLNCNNTESNDTQLKERTMRMPTFD